MLENEVKFCVHPGNVVFKLAYPIFEPLNALPLPLEAIVTLSTERAYQGFRQSKEKFLLNCLGKGFY